MTLRVESLEPRIALDADDLLSPGDRYVTLSFAGDGVQIGSAASSLVAKFDAQFPQQDWRETIVRAFQTWAAETSIDIGWTDEDGTLPFGTPGPRSGDARFGDIRIGARPLGAGAAAISVSQESMISGTWVADVIFNSSADFSSLDDLFSVALHEAGHVFGMSHSDDPNSPMHVHGASSAKALTAADIAEVQSHYGVRLPDAWEGAGGNETIDTAADLEPIEAVEEIDGSGPAIALGNILGAADVDFYRIESIDGYTGPLTIRLNTAGTSLLRANLTVMTADGTPLASLSYDGPSSASLEYTIGNVQEDSEYLIRVTSAVDDVFAQGGYALMATFDDALQTSSEQIDSVLRSRLRLSEDEIESLLSADDDDFLNPDGGSDDSKVNARNLEPAGEFNQAPRYIAKGSVESLSDVDVYRIKSPENTASLPVMRVSLQSLEPGTLIPQLRILDEDQRAIPAEVLVNGGGELVVQAGSIDADREYHVTVAAAADTRFSVGDYQLAIDFAAEPTELQTFAAGSVSGETGQSAHRLYVATAQLFHLALSIGTATTTRQAGVMLRVLTEAGEPVHQLTSPAGQTRTGGSVLLEPGAYTLQVIAVYESPSDTAVALSYQLAGDAVSDPFAVDPVEPSEAEFLCPDLGGMFCYPGGIVSPDPFLWFDFLDQLPEPPDVSSAELQAALLGDWWSWYWGQQGDNVPPLGQDDSYSVAADSSLVVGTGQGVLSNDLDPDSREITLHVLQPPAHGRLAMNFDGSFTYQPAAGFAGVDQFVYAAYDFHAASSRTIVTIDVLGGTLQGDFTGDGIVNELDLNQLCAALQSGRDLAFDVSGDQQLDSQDWDVMVADILGTSFGDANLDGEFNSSDLVMAFQAGQYEDGVVGNSTWRSGDWNGDGEFDSSDLVFAFQWGGYVL